MLHGQNSFVLGGMRVRVKRKDGKFERNMAFIAFCKCPQGLLAGISVFWKPFWMTEPSKPNILKLFFFDSHNTSNTEYK